ncbi:Pyruvate kinase [Phytophthora palmivora]|uniref:Pyruvate kinase n=1 Tax=Phytophthora palmivora TaxID=4796 RepID=A0A2P4XST6_9STRA|nr:Pyruvate kinase [Phytophthora palmivora]
MLAPLRYAYCGQMKKLTWMLQQKREERRLGGSPKLQTLEHVCVTCRSKAGGLFSTKCRICLGDLCMSCSIKKRLSFLSPDSSLVRHKVAVYASLFDGLIRVTSTSDGKGETHNTEEVDNHKGVNFLGLIVELHCLTRTIANDVLDGDDCVMLSDESAQVPIESVATMNTVIMVANQLLLQLNYQAKFQFDLPTSDVESVVSLAVLTANEMHA